MEKITINLKEIAQYVKPVLENLYIYPSNVEQVFNHENSTGYDIVKVAPVGDILTTTNVKSTDEEQIVTPNDEFLGFSQVIVEPINLQEKEVKVNAPTNIFVHPDDGYDGLCIVNVVANVDTETKEITPTKEIQNIERSEGKYIESVTINAIPDNYIEPSGELDITENGNYDVTENASVNVDIQPNVAPKTITSNGIYNASDDGIDGYSSVEVETSGVDLNEYIPTDGYRGSISGTTQAGHWIYMLKKMPKLTNIRVGVSGFFRAFKGTEFEGIENLDLTTAPNSSITTDYSSLFYECTNVVSLNLKNWDMSEAKNISSMFHTCSKLENLTINSWDVGKVTNFSMVFQNCRALETLNIEDWNVSAGTNFANMFYNATKIKNVNFSKWRTGIITQGGVSSMFNGASSIEEIDLSGFNVSECLRLQNVFSGCTSLKTLNLEGWDAGKVYGKDYNGHFNDIFKGCSSLENLTFMNNLGKGFTATASNNQYSKLDLSACVNLTHESLMDVINKLYDLNLTYDVANGGTLYTQQLILGETNIAKLSEAELDIARNKGWTIS